MSGFEDNPFGEPVFQDPFKVSEIKAIEKKNFPKKKCFRDKSVFFGFFLLIIHNHCLFTIGRIHLFNKLQKIQQTTNKASTNTIHLIRQLKASQRPFKRIKHFPNIRQVLNNTKSMQSIQSMEAVVVVEEELLKLVQQNYR